MKQREGFVSNSSSTSFVVFGKYFTQDEFQNKFGLTEEEMESIMENGIEDSIAFNEKIKDQLTDIWTYSLGDGYYIIGTSIGGDRADIISDMDKVIAALGDGCKLYVGMDVDGDICLE